MLDAIDRPGIDADAALVERIRAEVRALGFEPVGDAELARIREADLDAKASSEFEGSYRDRDEVLLAKMLFEERAPLDVRTFATRRLLEETIGGGRSLAQAFSA